MNEKVITRRFVERPYQTGPELIVDEVASVLKDDLFRGWIGERLENPDQVLAKEGKGQGLKFYEALERDCHVSSVLQKRKLAVIGKEWGVDAASASPKDQEIADFVAAVFKNMGACTREDHAAAPKSGFDAARMDLLSCFLKGFSVGELIWRVETRGPLAGAVVLDEIKGRDQRRFSFDPQNRLRLLTLGNALEGELLPPRKFVVLTFRKENDNPWGAGLGQQLWWPVWFKKHGIKFWATFMEKFGMPTIVGKYPSGTKKELQDALLAALRAIQQETAVQIPKEMEVELLEATRQGSLNTYGDFVSLMDAQISKAVLGETLTTEVGETGGAFAASQTHDKVRGEEVKADADLLCEGCNNQIVPPLVQFNFPGVTAYPKVWIKTQPEADLTNQSLRDWRLVSFMGLPISKQYCYETYGVRPPADAEDTLTPPSMLTAQAQADPNTLPGSAFAEARALVDRHRQLETVELLREIREALGHQETA